jgi:hypothetical protein
MIPGVDTRGRDIAATNARGGGGGGGGGGKQPGPVVIIGGLCVMGAIGGLFFGSAAAAEAFSLSSADAPTGFIVCGVSCGVLLVVLAIVYQENIMRWFGDGALTRAQTAPSELKVSAPGTLPLLAVVPPQGCV